MTGDSLDKLVDRARETTVRRDVADAYVRELDRWARPEPQRRAWIPWFAAGLAAATAVAIVLWVRPTGPSTIGALATAPAPVQVGERVAIIATEGTAYRVVAASNGETRIAVDHGSVTARLFHGDTPHHLALEGGGVIATATGTTYSLSVTPAGGIVHVDDGTVQVVDRGGVHAVAAGTSLPATAPTPDPKSAGALLQLSAPPPSPSMDPSVPVLPPSQVTPDASEVFDAPADDAPIDSRTTPTIPTTPRTAPMDAASPPEIKEQWRLARLLRGQGKFAEAIAQCLAIADAHDPTWSPIALVEAIRIYLGPMAAPEQAVATADRLLREWSTHALASETRSLRCQALGQLGRGSECAPPKP